VDSDPHTEDVSDVQRRRFNATIAALAVGGPLGEPIGRLADAAGRTSTPARVGVSE